MNGSLANIVQDIENDYKDHLASVMFPMKASSFVTDALRKRVELGDISQLEADMIFDYVLKSQELRAQQVML